MTVAELKEILEDLDDDLEVRTMTQESWPFENSIAGAVQASEIIDYDSDNADASYQPVAGRDGQPGPPDALYLVEGRQLGYGTKAAWASF